MAVAEATLTSGGDLTNLSNHDTASITVVAGRLYLLTVASAAGSNPADPQAVTGAGMTFELVNSILHTGASNNLHRIGMWRAVAPGNASGAITIDFAGTPNDCVWSISEFTGIDDGGGSNGSAAIVQSVTARLTATGTSLGFTLAAFGAAGNAAFACFGVNTNGDDVIPEWNEESEVSLGADGATIETQFIASADTTGGASWTNSVKAGCVAVEIKATVAASTVKALAALGVG